MQPEHVVFRYSLFGWLGQEVIHGHGASLLATQAAQYPQESSDNIGSTKVHPPRGFPRACSFLWSEKNRRQKGVMFYSWELEC